MVKVTWQGPYELWMEQWAEDVGCGRLLSMCPVGMVVRDCRAELMDGVVTVVTEFGNPEREPGEPCDEPIHVIGGE